MISGSLHKYMSNHEAQHKFSQEDFHSPYSLLLLVTYHGCFMYSLSI